jgi:hypothetical protein
MSHRKFYNFREICKVMLRYRFSIYYLQGKFVKHFILYPLDELRGDILRFERFILKYSLRLRRKWDKEMYKREHGGL